MNQDSSAWRYSTYPVGDGAPQMWDRSLGHSTRPLRCLLPYPRWRRAPKVLSMSRHLIDTVCIDYHLGGARAGTSV